MDWARGVMLYVYFFNFVSRSIRLFSLSGSNGATLAHRGGSIKNGAWSVKYEGGGLKGLLRVQL